MRQFDNPYKLSKEVALYRLAQLDSAAELSIIQVTRLDGTSTTYIAVDGTSTDEQLSTLFNQAVTAEEIAFFNNKALDMQALKDAYQNMITRLEQIQAVTNPTNAQVIQAIKDIALYEERIMKVLKEMIV